MIYMPRVTCALFLCLALNVVVFAHADSDYTSFESKYKKITLDKKTIKSIGIKTKKIKEEIIDSIIKTTGQIEEIPNNHFDVNSQVTGKVKSILVQLGDKVSAGQNLATIQSTEVASLQADVHSLEAEHELAKKAFEREGSLFEKGISAKKEFELTKARLDSVEARLKAALNNLKLLSSQEVSEQGIVNIKSPKQGVIIERNITLGQIVDSNQILFHGTDISKVLASADIYEKDSNQVKSGEKIFVTLDGVNDKIFEGKITYVGSVINPDTRTLPVKATLVNTPDTLLRPGAFCQIVIHTSEMKKGLTIPRSALVDINKEDDGPKHTHIVYVKDKDTFVPRKVEVESHDSNLVEVVSGLEEGEIIVTQGGYQLQYGEEHHDEHEMLKKPSTKIMALAFIIGILFVFLLLRRRKNDRGND